MNEPESAPVRVERDPVEPRIALLVLDAPGRSANTMDRAYHAAMGAALDRLEAERDTFDGFVVASAKKTFFAGGDLAELSAVTRENAAAFAARTADVKRQLRRLETLGRPVVAALTGSALGGGLEIALACHHRIALDDPSARFGFPEVTLGLLPGAGGVTRTVRLLGVADALTKVLLQGKRLRPAQAVEIGIVHELAADRDALMAAARAWIAAHPDAVQPWDAPGARPPGGTPAVPRMADLLPSFPANLAKQLKGAPYPAPHHILCAAVEGSQLDLDTALAVEGRYFTDLAVGQTAKNMIKAFFYDMQHIRRGGSRPEGHAIRRPTKVAVLGAGMMGAGIAHACVSAGLPTVLRDTTRELAERGRDAVLALAAGRGLREQAAGLLTATDDLADLAGCDLVIEAVFEDPALKARVHAEAASAVAPDALLCTNTSTLPVSGLAEAVERRGDFLGLHFFSPVHKMKLVEVVRGRETSDAALARALDVVALLGKTPIVVNDSRGFFTSRVISTCLEECYALLAEGVPAASVEQASLQAGYPAGGLQLTDELTLTLGRRIGDETRDALAAAGTPVPEHPGDGVLARMVDEFGRPGRPGGAGFYDYGEDGRRTRLWPGLAEAFGPVDPDAVPFEDAKERLLFAEALESARCVEEGVITSAADANIGSILGIGFPAWTGGVLQYINGYQGGVPGFVARAEKLAATYGPRFEPPRLLRDMATRGETF
ncbi:3-hydroxyacyl-CoA dehydrogenase [Mangrovactinospora gilvigrisea]|uniref:3-hydroxyacyl-CoA dehydrogenase n=1 Tax=Mangrovactinospora gilvigrisea TaxID=1428644 RepID=A0A1J7BH16_9ACTN|nr:3-hydroxyacyl-CoA dehydrogenase NAD-binding domain-containing protein [Mangrovactinospora gilvigrisea]OIV37975.1 3-hydroxyacyl-CoA dehydrogenase [Mangrovactinospora gilvigrisea]